MNMTTISVLIPYLEKTEYMVFNKKLLEQDPRILEFITLEGISPISKARQHLLKQAKGDYVLWIDSDVELINNPLNEMLSYFSQNVAGVCATTIEMDKTYMFDSAVRKCLPKVYHKKKSHFNCGLFKKKYLFDIGGFDTKLIAAEDNDLQIRLNKAGYHVLGLKKVTVLHHSSRSFEKEKWYFEGYKTLFNKHGFCENECDQVDLFSNKFRFEKLKSAPVQCLLEMIKGKIKKNKNRLRLLPEIWYNLLIGLNPELIKSKESGLLITENCMFKCKSCTYWKNKTADLSKEQIFKIVDNLVEFGIKKIVLVGGEPLIRNDLGDIINYIKMKKIKCGMITNGFFGSKRLTELLKLDFINVSIDGLEKTHDTLRDMKGAWNRAVNILFELKKRYNKEVSVSFVLQEKNYKEFKLLHEFLNNFEIPLYILCYSSGGMGQPKNKGDYSSAVKYLLEQNSSYLKVEQREYLNLILNKFLKHPLKQCCITPNIKFMIGGKGDLYPCSAWDKPIGNVLNQSLEQIWRRYSNLRKQIFQGNHHYCEKCVSCELINNFVSGNPYIFKTLIRSLNKFKFI